jgi:hypothetical protein
MPPGDHQHSRHGPCCCPAGQNCTNSSATPCCSQMHPTLKAGATSLQGAKANSSQAVPHPPPGSGTQMGTHAHLAAVAAHKLSNKDLDSTPSCAESTRLALCTLIKPKPKCWRNCTQSHHTMVPHQRTRPPPLSRPPVQKLSPNREPQQVVLHQHPQLCRHA